ncbi:MAG: GntR family transcriptional regulator [Chitinivibrionales bacterium]|nr:GntR family transcriptional regulator [Chitinivibrionales bacterium]MBD3358132.1 GntR family transcriptional regulator [Chitinivibrionales bacterium]
MKLKTIRLVELMAEQVKEYISRNNVRILPPSRTLAKNLGISTRTLTKVFNKLSEEGVIDVYPRKRARVRSAAPHIAGPAAPFEEVLRMFIQAKIASGEYHVGTELPKINWFVSEYDVSYRTVSRVLKSMEREGVIHRKGNRYLAGPRRQFCKIARYTQEYATILICAPNMGYWRYLSNSRFTTKFCEKISDEAIRHLVRFRYVVYPQKVEMSENGEWRETLRNIEKEVHNVRGFLVLGEMTRHISLPAVIKACLSYGRPVVWFDRMGTGAHRAFPEPNYYRCFYSDAASSSHAAEYLAAVGHKRVCFVMLDLHKPGSDWQELRAANLKRAFDKIPESSLFTVAIDHFDLQRDPDAGVTESLAMCMEQAPPKIKGFFEDVSEQCGDYLRRRGIPLPDRSKSASVLLTFRLLLDGKHDYERHERPRLAALLSQIKRLLVYFKTHELFFSEIGLTAIIGPNYVLTKRYISGWLSLYGLRVPDDISLLTFDHQNSAPLSGFNTVNHGFEYLGYRAFHIIVGMLPKEVGIHEIQSVPSIVDLGTVGPRSKSPSTRHRHMIDALLRD